MNTKYFSDIFNKYQVSKTIRFSLKPQGRTRQTLEDNNIIPKDSLIYKSYLQTKPYLDDIHRKIIQQGLSKIEIEIFKPITELYYQKNIKTNKQDKE
ncbi:MAG: hypothetical protein PHO23_00085 [Candidatus Pacebacteria bacterium]|nr:hypothetical protein [Candidatus Paceibacterota bacterium]